MASTETISLLSLVKDLCSSILDKEDPETLEGKAAFLQGVIDGDWSTMDSYSPVYGEGRHLVGVTKVR